jgi:hypothetical protein
MPAGHATVFAELRRALLETRGALEAETRLVILGGGGPEELQPYLEKVRRHAYKVVDGDIAALRETGWSDDALFEATVAAAVGEGLRRYELAVEAIG